LATLSATSGRKATEEENGCIEEGKRTKKESEGNKTQATKVSKKQKLKKYNCIKNRR
jgi:hypothetical protein